jgi:hypothetical protein
MFNKIVLFVFFSLLFFTITAQNKADFITHFEKNNNETAPYTEGVAYYQKLAKAFPKLLIFKEAGVTDIGKSLHVAILSLDETFTPKAARLKNKTVLFINNAIHPGEPEGVDATMMILRDMLLNKEKQVFLKHLVIVVIPYYNVDGVLNRAWQSRINQNGPDSYGFRGNSRNLDLNRDFIKCDSRNAQSFNKLFTTWQPDIFIDNHTSNGADYQYTMTMLATQKDKLNSYLADYQQNTLLPRLFNDMKKLGWGMIPYVSFEDKVEEGIQGFYDSPRYSSGYAALHNCIGFVPETHMLKPFPDRVKSTYAFMDCMIHAMHDDYSTILANKKNAILDYKTKNTLDVHWVLDTTRKERISFKGFEAGYKTSEVSGLPRLFYDRTQPFEREIPYFPHFKARQTVTKPKAYIVPQSYQAVIERLRWNGVEMTPLSKDSLVEAEFYTISDYKSSPTPYENHHFNRDVSVEKKTLKRQFYKGDFLISTNQTAARYIVETLEPQAYDSFFAWNFFDGILNQKEYFSAYVFEDVAADLLKKNPEIKRALDEKRATDSKFAQSAAAQLDFVYRLSPYVEPTLRLYPVARIVN